MGTFSKCLVFALVAAALRLNVRCQDCNLDGYDLGTLDETDYWTFRVEDPRNCRLPLGYQPEDVESCDMFFSMCRPLGNVCEGNGYSSVCQLVVTTDGNKTYYDMGAYKSNEDYIPLSGADVGFTVPRQAANSIVSADCNKTVYTITTFVCNASAIWDPSDHNVTTHLSFVREIFGVSCLYSIEFMYSGGCYTSPTLSPAHCMLDEYDTNTLKSTEYWLATVDSSVCFDSTVTSCKFYLSFCHPVPPSIGAGCYSSSVCQIGTSSAGANQQLSMGAYANFTRFHENDEQGSSGGFYMRVENGSRPNNGSSCPNGISTQVTLVCDKSAKWEERDISKFVDVAYNHQEPCSYMLRISYNGACAKENPVIDGSSSPQSPFGWILIGLVAFVVIVYLSVGMIYNRLRKGATGLQLIPHYDFWFSFVMLVLGGCYFFLDCVTCFKFDGKIVRKQPDYDKI